MTFDEWYNSLVALATERGLMHTISTQEVYRADWQDSRAIEDVLKVFLCEALIVAGVVMIAGFMMLLPWLEISAGGSYSRMPPGYVLLRSSEGVYAVTADGEPSYHRFIGSSSRLRVFSVRWAWALYDSDERRTNMSWNVVSDL